VPGPVAAGQNAPGPSTTSSLPASSDAALPASSDALPGAKPAATEANTTIEPPTDPRVATRLAAADRVSIRSAGQSPAEPTATKSPLDTQGATETVESPRATARPVQAGLPSAYHARVAAAGGFEGGKGDLGQGASPRDQSTAFGFGSQTLSGHVMPALRLASSSFATALAQVPGEGPVAAHTANQIVQTLKLQWARGGGAAEIQLEPSHLGELRIALKVEARQVSARLEAEAPVVREWLQSNQTVLRQGLADQNLTLDRLEIVEPRSSRESRDADRQDSRGRDGQSRSRQGRRRRDQGGELFEVVA
jgi:flagellar hook-length control protein FliK